MPTKCPSHETGEGLNVRKEIATLLTLFGSLLVMWLLGLFRGRSAA